MVLQSELPVVQIGIERPAYIWRNRAKKTCSDLHGGIIGSFSFVLCRTNQHNLNSVRLFRPGRSE